MHYRMDHATSEAPVRAGVRCKNNLDAVRLPVSNDHLKAAVASALTQNANEGPVSARTEKEMEPGLPQLILLDHGLYRDVTEDFRIK